MPDRRQDPSNLAIPPLVQDHLELGEVLLRFLEADRRHPGYALGQTHAALELVQLFDRRLTDHANQIGLGHAVPGMRQTLRQSLPEICDLSERFGVRLMIDEAHGAGVLGRRGAGTAELLGVEDRVDLRVGTFSKSLAACGGFVAGPADVIDFLRVQSRAYLFTASSVPAAVGATLAALRVLRSDEGPDLLAAVLANAWALRDGLRRPRLRGGAPQPLRSPTAQLDAPGCATARSSRRSFRSSSATTGRRCCCGVRSTDAGVFVNVACTQPYLRVARCCARASWRPTTAPRSTVR